MSSKQRGSIFFKQGSHGYSLSYTVNGKRQQVKKQGFATKKQAEQALTKALGNIDGGRLMGAGRQTVEAFLLSWLENYERSGRVKQTTLASVRQHTTKYIIPHLGAVPLSKLSPSTVSKFYGDLLTSGRRKTNQVKGAGLSAKTVRNISLTLQQALKDAVRWQLLPINPATGADLPRYERPALTVFDDEQTGQFLHYARTVRDPFAALWQLMFATGLRRGELCGLRWQDIDLVEGRISVVQTRTIADDRVITSTPKSSAGKRTISIDSATVTALAELKNQQEAAAQVYGHWGTDLVAATLEGRPVHPKALYRQFQTACKAAGLPVIRLHDGRHTSATSALQNGTAIHIVAGRVGHSQVSTTLNTYAHFLPSADRLAADTIGAAIQQAVKVAEGSRKVAATSELTELGNTVKPYTPLNMDFPTTTEPEKRGSPGARTQSDPN